MFTPGSPPGIGGRSGAAPATRISCACGNTIHTLKAGETIQPRAKEFHLGTLDLECSCGKKTRMPIFQAPDKP